MIAKGSLQRTVDDIPRRHRIDHLIPAELAITSAMNAVEHLGADVLLTEAVILLQEARNKVADFLEAEPTEEEGQRNFEQLCRETPSGMSLQELRTFGKAAGR